MKTVMEKLCKIQHEINVPKNQRNNFGKYNYRSMEDIAQALKPFVDELKVFFTCQDDIVMVGQRIYVKATVTITDAETGDSVSNTAFAREDENKKGMDGSQLTGACSSYARKYAMNGLLLIDDVKDADTGKHDRKPDKQKQKPPQQQPPKGPTKMSDKQNKMIWALANKAWTDEEGNPLNGQILSSNIHSIGADLMLSETSKEWTSKDASAVIKKIQEVIDGNELPPEMGGY